MIDKDKLKSKKEKANEETLNLWHDLLDQQNCGDEPKKDQGNNK